MVGEAKMICFEELLQLMGAKIKSEFKVIDIDIAGEEVCLREQNGGTIIVDLRDQYLTEARKWKRGYKIRATIVPAKSRFTPFLVWVFEEVILLKRTSKSKKDLASPGERSSKGTLANELHSQEVAIAARISPSPLPVTYRRQSKFLVPGQIQNA
jgi:hypothetical protein